jgi:hypothetical protein
MGAAMKRRAGIPILLICGGLLAGAAWAQETASGDDASALSAAPASTQAAQRHGPGRPDIAPARRLFEPLPEDHGPLAAGEADELLAFAEAHLPRIHAILARLKAHSPARFETALAEHAPRLRQLRRIYERDAQLGEIIRDHAENMMEVLRLAHTLKQQAGGPPAADVEPLRKVVAINMGLEADALARVASDLEANREQRIAQRVSQALSPDANAAEQREPLTGLVATYKAAQTEPEREAARAQLRAFFGRQVANEIQRLRERSAQLRSEVDTQVDRRVEMLLKSGGRKPPGGPPRRE